MSSDIDDDGDYSSIDGRDPKMEIKNGAIVNNVCDDQSADSEGGGGSDALKKKLQQQSASSHPAYSNIPSMETGNDKSLSKREKNRYPSANSGSPSTRQQFLHSRKSRSRERPDQTLNAEAAISGLYQPSLPINAAAIDSERIRERERELEKIHRRSRELMLSPRFHDTNLSRSSRGNDLERSSREGSMDRRGGGVAAAAAARAAAVAGMESDHSVTSSVGSGVVNEGWKPMAPPLPPHPPSVAAVAAHHAHHHHPPNPLIAPPPLPPRIHSPPNGNILHSNRYKSPSPAMMQQQHHHHHQQQPHPHQQQHPHQHHQSQHHRFAANHQNTSLRRRVQSPNRRDFKDFSRPQREFRSPMKINHSHHRSYIDEDDDSGADSLGNDFSSSGGGGANGGPGHCNCASCNLHYRNRHSSSMALVPYQDDGAGCDSCGGGGFYRPPPPPPTNYPLQTMPGVEERLLQLEGDKDSLHLQVALLSDQIDVQTDKISDLEKVLDDKKDVLRKTEDVLQREVIARSSLETKKLELMSDISGLKLRQAAVEKENMELRKKLESVVLSHQQHPPHMMSPQGRHQSPQSAVVDTIITLPPTGQPNQGYQQNNRYPLICPPSSTHTTLQTFGTLPRRSRRSENHLVTSIPIETHFNQFEPSNGNGSGGWGIGSDRKLSSAHSGSAPSLNAAAAAAGEVAMTIPRSARHQSTERSVQQQYVSQVPMPAPLHQQPIATKPKGLKKILGKMRRANSGTIHDDKKSGGKEAEHSQTNANGASSGTESLRRGGFRASAGSRFAAWMGPTSSTSTSNPPPHPDINLTFRQWKVETICSWLDNLGLYMYNSEVRRHVKVGDHMLAMSNHDLENKLGIKSVLHRKKILLALQAKQLDENGSNTKCNDLPGRLDHQWVVRWLDDVGLPQYKDAFLEARVDGRVLNFLTVDDLFQLKVTNLLHHLSIKRGIQVLRQNGFSPSCLKRRASPEEKERDSLPIEVSLWSNHRVMEWLRHVDLAEYAPNLRGSGVHGGLLIFEVRFTSELFASLLSIPSSKTLLRRHLGLHFRDLIGRDVVQEKRTAEEEPQFAPLTPTAKVKPIHGKRSQFSLRRRKFSGSGMKAADEMDVEDLVCPEDEDKA